MRNIYRYEHHYFRGWVVNVKRRGIRHTKYFPDPGSDSKASLGAAIIYRDRLLSRLPPPVRVKRTYRLNRTGVVGVALTRERTRQGGRMRRYVATWPVRQGRRMKRSFSVAYYGAAEAKRLAIQARRRGLKELLKQWKA